MHLPLSKRRRFTSSALAVAALTATWMVQADPITDYEVIDAPAMSAPEANRAALIASTTHAGRVYAVGDYGVVLSWPTADPSQWRQHEVGTSVLLTDVSFAPADAASQAWAVGHHGVVMHSEDGGNTWTQQISGFDLLDLEKTYYESEMAAAQAELAAATDDEAVDDLSFAVDEFAYLLENVELAREEGPTKPLLTVHALSNEQVLAAGAYGLFIESKDAGESWTMRSGALENPNGFHLNVITSGQIGGEAVIIMAGEAGQLFRSLDGGESWATLASPYDGSFFGAHIANERLWVYGLRGHIFYSDDAGESFTRVMVPTTVNLSGGVTLSNGDTLIVGHSGTIIRVNADAEFSAIYTHPSSAVISDIAVTSDDKVALTSRGGLLTFAFTLPTAIPTTTTSAPADAAARAPQ